MIKRTDELEPGDELPLGTGEKMRVEEVFELPTGTGYPAIDNKIKLTCSRGGEEFMKICDRSLEWEVMP